MLDLYGIDVRAPFPEGFEGRLGWDTLGGQPDPGVSAYQFHIPAGLVGEIYGTERWPLGS